MKDKTKKTNPIEHLSNERTFLAWIRTCIGIMAFGFVIEKFTVFINEASLYFGKEPPKSFILYPKGFTSWFALCIVFFAMILSILAFLKYKKVEKEIEKDAFERSLILDIMLILSVLVIGLFLILYLFRI